MKRDSTHVKANAKPSRKPSRKPAKKATRKIEAKSGAFSGSEMAGSGRSTVSGMALPPRMYSVVADTRKVRRKRNKLALLREDFGASKEQMASVIGLSATTYSRRETTNTVEAVEEHRVRELEETWGLAVAAFHKREDAAEWFHSEIPSLESEKPIDVMAEPGGVARVKNILQRIYYGGY